jgi:threonine dehydrogenase-like Zn-dependent dehydrogenase
VVSTASTRQALPSVPSAGDEVPVLELQAPGRIGRSTRPLGRTGAVLELEVTGVCGSDRHIVEGRIPVPLPLVLGHELVGRLVELDDASGVVAEGGVHVGDRVAVAPGIDCGRCPSCVETGYCERRLLYGLPGPLGALDGGLTPYLSLLPGTRVFRVPETLPPRRAALAEIVACGVQAVRRSLEPGADGLGRSACVVGFGPAGLAVSLAASSSGAHVLVVETDEERAGIARELGFEAFLAEPGATPEEVAADVGAAYGRIDVAFECAGVPAALALGVALPRTGGTVVEMGHVFEAPTMPLAPHEICLRDLRLIGTSVTSYEDFPAAIRVLETHAAEIEHLVTTVAFDEVDDAKSLFDGGGYKRVVVFGEWPP